MKKFNFFEKLWKHSRTLRRVGLVLVMCLMAIPQLWATSGIKLRGDYVGGFSYTSDTWTKGVNGDETKRYWDVYHSGGSKFWRIWLVYYNHDGGPDNENEDYDLNEGTLAYMVVNKNKHSFVTTADPGILRIKVDQYGSDKDRSKDEYPYVWVERPDVEFKYPWDGVNWTKVTAHDNRDGTYTYEGTYQGVDRFNAGPNGADKIAPEGTGEGTTVIIGSPTTGRRCEFKWQPGTGDPNTDYKYTGGEEDNRGRFTITKLCTITYYANGGTGDAPDLQEVLYGADQTLRGNTGSLAKTDFVFVGWNTASDGSGDHYDVGATLEDVETDVDLYAEWVSGKWGVKGKGGDGALGSDFETFHVLRKISTNKYKGSVSLGAHQVYEFKITDNTTWYGKSDIYKYFLGQTNTVNLETGGGSEKNCIIATGNAGEYVFEFNETAGSLSITYPNGNNHPSTNFVYYSNPNSWGTIKAYIYDDPQLTDWANSPILGTPVTIGGNTYYYTALGDRNDVIFQNGSGGQTDNLDEADTEVGHYYNTSWAQFTVRITLNNQSATSAGTEYKDVKFNYDELTTSITCPTKTGYSFGGYYTEENGEGVQIINASGVWQASVSGYTDGDRKWIKDGGNATLYAKWTEKTWNVTAQVSPAGTGYANPSSATSYGEVTGGAISASNNTGYHFSTWSITSGSGSFTSAVTTASNTFKPTSATTLTATFVANTYDLDLDSEGGSSGSSSVTVTYNSSSHTAITNPTKTGYTFGGWYDGDDGTGNLVINTSGVLQVNVSDLTGAGGIWIKDGTPTLYAKWTANTYNVRFNANDANYVGTASGSMSNQSHTYGSSKALTSNGFSLANHEFLGWATTPTGAVAYDDEQSVKNLSSTQGATVDLYAKWGTLRGRVFKFEVSNSVSSGNVCTTSNSPLSLTATGGGATLSTLEGGSLNASVGTNGHLAYTSSNSIGYIRYANGTSGVLQIDLTCPLKTGDVIKWRSIGSSSGKSNYLRHTASDRTSDQITLPASYPAADQVIELSSDFNDATTLFILAYNNSVDFKSFEIIRPYSVTLDASTNGGKVNGKDSQVITTGGSKYFPHADKSGWWFKGWFEGTSGGVAVTEPYEPSGTSNITLYAQYGNCTSSVGSIFAFQVKTGLTNGSASTKDSYFDVDKSNYLATLYGGTMQGYAGTIVDNFKIVNTNAIRFGDNVKGRLKIDLDCAIQTGDTLKVSTSGSSGAKMIIATGESSEAIQTLEQGTNVKAVAESGLVGQSTIYIRRKESKDVQITAFEIIRPAHYTITHDLSHVTTSSPEEVIHKAGYTATYTADDGYELPDAVTVMRGVTNITASCTWVQGTGTLTIPAADCIGDITISITGDAAAPTYGITNGDPSNGSILIQISSSDVTEGEEGDQVDIVATPNTGYSFSAWNIYKTETPATTVEPNAETASTYFTMPAYAVTVDASFTINSWDLSWNFDDGETSADEGDDYTAGGTTEYGTAITYPGNGTMSKTGHTFIGWSSSATTMPDNDLEITALWSANQYNVADHTLSNATLSSGGATGTNKATYGTNYTATFAANTGYNLPSDVTVQIGGVTKTKGEEYSWNSSTGELSINSSAILGDIAISVTAVAKTYTLTLKENGGTGGDGSATITWNQREVSYASEPSAPSASFSLDGYYTAATGGTKIINGAIKTYIVGEYIEGWTTNTINPSWARDDDATLYAHWRRVVLFDANSEYHGTSGGNTMVMLNGSPFSYTTATGESGYTLQGYYTDKLGGTKVFNADGTYAADDVDGYIDDGAWVYTTSGTLSLYAHWAKEYTVTYNGNSADDGDAPDAVDAFYGTTVTVAGNTGSLEKDDYTFVGWNTSSAGTGTFYAVGSTFTLTNNITLYAQWEDCSGGGSTTVFSLTSITGVGDGLITTAKDVGAYYDASSYCTLNSLSDGVYVGGCSNSGSFSNRNLSYEGTYNAWSFGQNTIYLALYSATGFKAGDVVTMVVGTSNTQSPAFAKASASTLDDLKNTDYNYYSTYHLTMSSETAPASGNSYTYTGTLPEGFVSSNWLIVYRPGQTFKMQSITVTRSGGGGGCTTRTVSFENGDDFDEIAALEDVLPRTITGVYTGSTIAEPVSPKADGYAFAGWYKEGACTNKWDFSTDVVSSAKTLYAKWIDIDDTYTFHMGDGDIDNDSWKVVTFTPTGVSDYQAITNFEIPNQDRYPSFFVGYEGEFVEYAPSSGYSNMREWDDYTSGYGYQLGRIHIQGNVSPISDGDTKTAEGAIGTLQMSSTTHSENWGLTFIPKGFGLTIAYTEDATPKTLVIPFHQTDNPNIWETESFATSKSNTLTSDQVGGTFKVGLATKTDNVYVDCYQSTAEAASAVNARKLDAAYGGANIAAGASGRFQIIMSTNSSTSNFGLRWVPLENHTKQSGSWDGIGSATTLANKWSLGHAPTIDETVYIEHNTTITNDAQANSIRINKESEYMDLTIASTGSLLVTNDIQAKMADEDEEDYRATTAKDLRIETNYISNGALITATKSTDTQASYRFSTKAYKLAGYGYINQFIGIPFTEMSAYQLYGTLLYQYDAKQNKWVTCSTTMVADSAYNILRRETDGRADFLINGTLNLPGIEVGDKEKVLTCKGGRSAEASSWRGEHLFANSWTAPIDVKAMTEGDFSDVDPTIYIFNAGSVNTATDQQKSDYDLGNNPGQWTALPVNDVKANPGNYPYTVIPAMQAFSIRATELNGTLTLDYKKHVYDPIADSGAADHTSLRAPKQNTDLPSIRLWLIVTGESLYKDDAQIHERADFSDGHDAGWDGYKIFGNAHSPQLYTMSDNNQLSVNAIPNIEGTVVGFRKGSDDNVYTFSFKYNEDAIWYLNDLKEQTSTLISNENTYIFTAEEGDTEARFIISATPINAPAVTTDIDNVSDGAKARKIMINDKLYIILNGKMYDATGKAVK